MPATCSWLYWHLRRIKYYVYVKLKRGQPFVDSVDRGSVSEKNLVLFEWYLYPDSSPVLEKTDFCSL